MEQLTRICAKEAALHCFICEKRKDDVHCHQRVSGHCLVFCALMLQPSIGNSVVIKCRKYPVELSRLKGCLSRFTLMCSALQCLLRREGVKTDCLVNNCSFCVIL